MPQIAACPQCKQPVLMATRPLERPKLTQCEVNVVGLLCRGMSNMEIAHTLRVSHHTVRNHLASVFRKLGVHNRSGAVLQYMMTGRAS